MSSYDDSSFLASLEAPDEDFGSMFQEKRSSSSSSSSRRSSSRSAISGREAGTSDGRRRRSSGRSRTERRRRSGSPSRRRSGGRRRSRSPSTDSDDDNAAGGSSSDEEPRSRKRSRRSDRTHDTRDRHRRRRRRSGRLSTDSEGSDSDSDSSSSDSDDRPAMTPASAATTAAPQPEREDWMNMSSFGERYLFSSKVVSAREESANELRKHVGFVDMGGSTLRPRAPAPVVSDGGLSWKQRKLARARARAQESGRSLTEVWLEMGETPESLEELTAGSATGRPSDEQPGVRVSAGASGPRTTARTDYTMAIKDKLLAPSATSQGGYGGFAPDLIDGTNQRRGDHIFAPVTAPLSVSPPGSPDRGASPAGPVSSASESRGSGPAASGAVAGPAAPAAAPAAPAAPAALSVTERNKLAARIMRAEMKGDHALAQTLKAKLDPGPAAAPARASAPAADSHQPEGDSNVRVISAPMAALERLRQQDAAFVPSQVPGPNRPVATHDRHGNRVAYAGENSAESDLSTDELLRRERLLAAVARQSSSRDTDSPDAEFARNIARNRRYTDNLDYQDDNADLLAVAPRRARAKDHAKETEKSRQRAISDLQREERLHNRCWYCVDSPQYRPHLTISSGFHAYLALPRQGQLAPGHCLLVPRAHVPSSLALQDDDDCLVELRNFKKSLIQAFAARGLSCLFIERGEGTTEEGSRRRHGIIECIPLPEEAYDEAPIFFKKALLESDETWSQHRKVIDVRPRSAFVVNQGEHAGAAPTSFGLRRAVPPNLPFFFVEFSLDSGMAHIIEDRSRFPDDFGYSVVGGLLDMDESEWRRSRRRPDEASAAAEARRIGDFRQIWAPYDWTRALQAPPGAG
ncbi:hypothetical protein H696_02225 [Fonticula alba]|uniref:Cwf19-like C-terminal domain-containing protein n=1 Tax=Fonticula alba TaxID=691883 RepID=A0A058ZCW3_FONAL|nr:hypothetical protein H696_02225 [Fonticula alba]KCV71277.1 hypothetical protein H696_02225 [Fonticula alba]|eukprot:XP_009494400.1 hypothetical protein H696_02225 [Fonticula alba]